MAQGEGLFVAQGKDWFGIQGENLESATLDKNLVFDAPLYWSHALIISRLIPKPHAAPRLGPPLLLALRQAQGEGWS